MVKKEINRIKEKIEVLAKQVAKKRELYQNDVIPKKEFIKKRNELKFARLDLNLKQAKLSYQKAQLRVSRSQKNIYALDYDKKLLKQLVEKDKRIHQLTKEVAKLKNKLERKKIKAPTAGKIQEVKTNIVGGVVSSAKAIISIAPRGTFRLIKGTVLNKDIGFIEEGDKAEIKLKTFPFQKYGTIPGEIIHISPTAVKSKNRGYVYKVKIRPSRDTINVNGRRVRISPGMSVTAEVKIGKRRIIEFFLPAVKQIKESFEWR